MNIPATREQVEEGNVINQFPNRRQRKFNIVPNSTKIAKCSMSEPSVYRTNKFGPKKKK